MKKLLTCAVLLFSFGCQYKAEQKVELNKKDNTQYFIGIVKLIDSASKLALNKQVIGSVSILQKAVDLQKFLIKLRNKVKEYEDHKQYQLAIDETKSAIAKLPDFADGYYKLGILYMKANQKQQSDEAFGTSKKLYLSKVEGYDTDRNRHLNYLNLIKIDIYTEDIQHAKQNIANFTRLGSGVTPQDSVYLSNLTKADLLSRTELVIN